MKFALIIVIAWAQTSAALAQSSVNEELDAVHEVYQTLHHAEPKKLGLVPAIAMRWLEQCALTPGEGDHHNTNFAALFAARELRLSEAGPLLASIYLHPSATVEIKSAVADAASAMPSAASKRLLETLRQDPTLAPRSHQHVLAALVTLDDQAARRELLDLARQWMSTTLNEELEIGYVQWVLRDIGDAKLIADLKALRDAQTESGKTRVLDDVMERMALHRSGVPELLALVEESDYTRHPRGAVTRVAALSALADKAGLDTIERLRALRPWSNVPADRNPAELQNYFNARRDEAIKRIRRLNWRTLPR